MYGMSASLIGPLKTFFMRRAIASPYFRGAFGGGYNT
jgi:hypothetical protein